MSEQGRLEALAGHIEGIFSEIARTRMAGLPFVNAQLGVAMRGLQRIGDKDTGEDVGVLVTPWFMNVIFLPADQSEQCRVGTKSQRMLPAGSFDVVWSHEDSIGGYWSASLFSPMDAFADMETAIATADEVLSLIFTRPKQVEHEEIREAIVNPGDGRDMDARLAAAEAEIKAEAEAQARAAEERAEDTMSATATKPERAVMNRRALFGVRGRSGKLPEKAMAR